MRLCAIFSSSTKATRGTEASPFVCAEASYSQIHGDVPKLDATPMILVVVVHSLKYTKLLQPAGAAFALRLQC